MNRLRNQFILFYFTKFPECRRRRRKAKFSVGRNRIVILSQLRLFLPWAIKSKKSQFQNARLWDGNYYFIVLRLFHSVALESWKASFNNVENTVKEWRKLFHFLTSNSAEKIFFSLSFRSHFSIKSFFSEFFFPKSLRPSFLLSLWKSKINNVL